MIVKKVTDSLLFLALGLLGAYAVLCLYAVVMADHFIFANSPPTYRATREILTARSSMGADIPMIFLQAPNARATILYSHGNLEDLGFIRPRLETFRAQGYNVLSYDYPGFGIATGQRNEAACNAAAQAAYDTLTQTFKIPPGQIILYGRSMGSGPATHLALTNPAAGLVLQSPFVSAFRVQTGIKILPWDRFDNLAALRQIKLPVLLVHGLSDETIPAWHSQMLSQAAAGPVTTLYVPFALHNNVIEIAREEYWQTLARFVTSTQK